MFNDTKLTFVRFCKFCLVEAVPALVLVFIVAKIVKLIEVISVILATGVFIFGTIVVCYFALKWIEYTCDNDKIQNWIER